MSLPNHIWGLESGEHSYVHIVHSPAHLAPCLGRTAATELVTCIYNCGLSYIHKRQWVLTNFISNGTTCPNLYFPFRYSYNGLWYSFFHTMVMKSIHRTTIANQIPNPKNIVILLGSLRYHVTELNLNWNQSVPWQLNGSINPIESSWTNYATNHGSVCYSEWLCKQIHQVKCRKSSCISHTQTNSFVMSLKIFFSTWKDCMKAKRDTSMSLCEIRYITFMGKRTLQFLNKGSIAMHKFQNCIFCIL